MIIINTVDNFKFIILIFIIIIKGTKENSKEELFRSSKNNLPSNSKTSASKGLQRCSKEGLQGYSHPSAIPSAKGSVQTHSHQGLS